MKAIKALYLANARDFLRDKMSMFLVLLLPVTIVGFFGLVFGSDGDPQQMFGIQMGGMLGVALLWLGLFGTALPIAQQRQGQVLRRLHVTPLSRTALLAAQVGWRVTIGLLQAGLFVLVGWLGFGVSVQGNPLLFVLAVLVGAMIFVSLGYLLAGLLPTVEGVNAVSQLVNFPMMFLSGSLFSLEMMPDAMQVVAKALPLTYLADAFRQLIVQAPPLYPLGLDFAVLGGWLALLLALGVRFWRWE
jgi:ABC-2 type transport system permease protein